MFFQCLVSLPGRIMAELNQPVFVYTHRKPPRSTTALQMFPGEGRHSLVLPDQDGHSGGWDGGQAILSAGCHPTHSSGAGGNLD